MAEKCVFKMDGRCLCLTRRSCGGCSFKKTKEQLDEGRDKALERIRTLPGEHQTAIYEKYYNRVCKAVWGLEGAGGELT